MRTSFFSSFHQILLPQENAIIGERHDNRINDRMLIDALITIEPEIRTIRVMFNQRATSGTDHYHRPVATQKPTKYLNSPRRFPNYWCVGRRTSAQPRPYIAGIK